MVSFGIKTPQTGAYAIDNNPKIQDAGYCDRADGSKAKPARVWWLSPFTTLLPLEATA